MGLAEQRTATGEEDWPPGWSSLLFEGAESPPSSRLGLGGEKMLSSKLRLGLGDRGKWRCPSLSLGARGSNGRQAPVVVARMGIVVYIEGHGGGGLSEPIT